MKMNMGGADRLFRLFLAVLFVALYYSGVISGVLGIILIVLAIINVLTSIFGLCPLYLPFGWNTTGRKKEDP